MGCTQEEAHDWPRTEGSKIARDPTEVSKWLGHLLSRWGGKPTPKALHGSDYQRLLGIQKRLDAELIEAVFGDPNFVSISRGTFHQCYLALHKQRGENGIKLGQNKLFARAVKWIADDRPEIELREYNPAKTTANASGKPLSAAQRIEAVREKLVRSKTRHVMKWVNTLLEPTVLARDTDEDYLEGNGNWLGKTSDCWEWGREPPLQ